MTTATAIAIKTSNTATLESIRLENLKRDVTSFNRLAIAYQNANEETLVVRMDQEIDSAIAQFLYAQFGAAIFDSKVEQILRGILGQNFSLLESIS